MAMVTAGSRGLDVELFVSEISDQFMVFHAQRSYYEQLLRAGVKIYLYRAPTILHAKHLQHRRRRRDDRLEQPRHPLPEPAHGAVVLVHGVQFDRRPCARSRTTTGRSRLLTLEDWLRRPRREKAFDNLMRLTSSLM